MTRDFEAGADEEFDAPLAAIEILCGVTEANCICELYRGHEGGHQCKCGGGWRWVGDTFVVLSFPGSARG